MSAFDIVPASPNGRLSLRDMEPGSVWISPKFLGVTPEEEIASRNGSMTPARQIEIYEAAQRANEAFVDMDVPGLQFWMSPKRAVN